MSRTQKLKTMRAAFDALEAVCQNGFRDEAKELYAICLREEKDHRCFMDDFRESHTSDTIGARDAAKLFVVHDLAAFILDKKPLPILKDYLHTKKSHFHAGAMALEFREKIQDAWKEFNITELAALDYCEFVRVKKDNEQPATA